MAKKLKDNTPMKFKHLANIHVIIGIFYVVNILLCGLLSILNVTTKNRYEQAENICNKLLMFFAFAMFLYYVNSKFSIRSQIIAAVGMLCVIYLTFCSYFITGDGGGQIHGITAQVYILCTRLLFVTALLWVLSVWKDMADKRKI